MKKNKGFSMVELMVVVAILGIVSTLAFPTFNTWIANSRLKSAARDMHSLLMTAKMNALKDGRRTSVAIEKDKAVMTQTLSDGTVQTIKTIEISNKKISFGPEKETITFTSAGITTSAVQQVITVSDGRTINVNVAIGGFVKIETPKL